MPPKGKKGKKGKKLPVLIDGVDTSAMTRDQLEAFALRLKAEMDREREERNYFQLERDKIRTFWEISREQLEETRIELRQKDKDVEITQDLADKEKKEVLQQMKYLQFENHAKIGEIRAEATVQLKISQENYILQELELLKDKRELRKLIRETNEMKDLQMHEIERSWNEKFLKERLVFDKERKDFAELHEQHIREMKEKIALFHRVQMFEVEERKNTHIKKLQEHHDLAFSDMKNYYNDITLNNLALIGSLKEQLELLRKQTERSDRIAAEATAESKRMRDPLESAITQMRDLRRKLEFYERDKQQLARIKIRNKFLEKRTRSLTWETEALILRNDTLITEREKMRRHFNDIIMELQHKTSLKTVLLERKVMSMMKEDERRRILLSETLDTCAPNFKVQLLGMEERINKALDEKLKTIEELRYELVTSNKAHDDLLETLECKMEKYGVPKDELGFTPMRHRKDAPIEFLCGTAGLVSTTQKDFKP